MAILESLPTKKITNQTYKRFYLVRSICAVDVTSIDRLLLIWCQENQSIKDYPNFGRCFDQKFWFLEPQGVF